MTPLKSKKDKGLLFWPPKPKVGFLVPHLIFQTLPRVQFFFQLKSFETRVRQDNVKS
jgi:hypothetical protein